MSEQTKSARTLPTSDLIARAEQVEAMLSDATHGPWVWRQYPGDECDGLTNADVEAAIVLDLGCAEQFENRHGRCDGGGNRALVAAAPDLARELADALRELAARPPVGSVPPEVYARDVLGPVAHTTRDVERTLIAHGATREDAARVVAKVTP